MFSTSPFGDTPNQLLNEAQNITLSRFNVGSNQVKLTWNIPDAYADNCVDGRRAYDGLIITAANHTFNPAEAPTSGQRYNSDNTIDENLHVGDRIGNALVVGTFYGDVTTVELLVNDVDFSKPVYFSAFAVSKELEYHSYGVHSYSLPYNLNIQSEEKAGYQEVKIGYQSSVSPFDINQFLGTFSGIRGGDLTGLDPLETYTFKIKTDEFEECTEVSILGSDTLTYDDLIVAINIQLEQLHATTISPIPPNASTYFFDQTKQKLFLFDGINNNEISVTIESTDPTIPSLNDIWILPSTNQISMWDGTNWNVVNPIQYHKSPIETLNSSDYWYDGTDVYKWEGNTWCKRSLNLTDIAATPSLPGGTYWYNTSTQLLNKLMDTGCFEPTNVIMTNVDPNALPNGYFWYDDVNEVVFEYDSALSVWNVNTTVNVRSDVPSLPADGYIWYNPTTDELTQWSSASSEWIILDNIIAWHEDPTDRDSCDLWWDSNIDQLFVWDIVNGNWLLVNSFIQTDIDPTVAPIVPRGELWLDGTNIKEWDGVYWNDVTYINSSYDPTSPITNEVWITNGTVYIFNGVTWDIAEPKESEFNPYTPNAGDFWLNDTNNTLNSWNGLNWTNVLFTSTDPTPQNGFEYFDTTLMQLLVWSDNQYVRATAFAVAAISENGNIVFVSRNKGTGSYVVLDDAMIFDNTTETILLGEPKEGEDSISNEPSFSEMGVGTDGSPEQRRELIDTIRAQLGWPVVDVELTKQQFDLCIDGALESLRKRSSIAYTRGFFFLDIEPGVQIYELKNRRVGYNKIVDVLSAYRVQSSFLGTATGQGAYGQAMLQHLYQMGSFDLVSYHIVSEYVEMMNQMFAAYLTYNWNEKTRKLSFFQTFGAYERVLIDCSVERTEQDLIADRMTKSWIERYAMGSAKLLLAQIRGKHASLPGAGGGVSLNAQELQVQGEQDIELCYQQIEDYLVNDPETWGYESSFLLG